VKLQVLLIHGFNVWDKGVGSVGELRGYCAALDLPYHILKYGHFGLWDARTKNDNVARQVKEFIDNSNDPVIVIAHSNGCTITQLAIELYAAAPEHCIFINPALRHDINLPNVCTYDIWHSPSDRPVKWAKYLPRTNFRPWGDMGAVGSTLGASHVLNYDKENGTAVSSKKHSDVFSTELLSFFAPLILRTALQRIHSWEK